MDHDDARVTDVSRYALKQEGATLLEPPGDAEGPRRARDDVRLEALVLRGRLAFRNAWVPGRGVRPRPAVHTAAGSFFLRGRP